LNAIIKNQKHQKVEFGSSKAEESKLLKAFDSEDARVHLRGARIDIEGVRLWHHNCNKYLRDKT
jgi:hypothetical protein